MSAPYWPHRTAENRRRTFPKYKGDGTADVVVIGGGLTGCASAYTLATGLFIAIGAYSINNSPFEVYMAALFGFFGYYASKWGCEAAPLILGFVLGPLMEENLRRAMLISRGDPSVFFTRPISLGMLLVSFALLLMVVMPQFQKKREILAEADD